MSPYKSALKSVYFAFALLPLWLSSSHRLVCCGLLLSFVAACELNRGEMQQRYARVPMMSHADDDDELKVQRAPQGHAGGAG